MEKHARVFSVEYSFKCLVLSLLEHVAFSIFGGAGRVARGTGSNGRPLCAGGWEAWFGRGVSDRPQHRRMGQRRGESHPRSGEHRQSLVGFGILRYGLGRDWSGRQQRRQPGGWWFDHGYVYRTDHQRGGGGFCRLREWLRLGIARLSGTRFRRSQFRRDELLPLSLGVTHANDNANVELWPDGSHESLRSGGQVCGPARDTV